MRREDIQPNKIYRRDTKMSIFGDVRLSTGEQILTSDWGWGDAEEYAFDNQPLARIIYTCPRCNTRFAYDWRDCGGQWWRLGSNNRMVCKSAGIVCPNDHCRYENPKQKVVVGKYSEKKLCGQACIFAEGYLCGQACIFAEGYLCVCQCAGRNHGAKLVIA